MAAPRLAVIASVVLALCGAAQFVWARAAQPIQPAIFLATLLTGPVWVVIAFVGLRRHAKRGLWVLVGLPSLLPLLALDEAVLSCLSGHGCL